MLIYYHKHICPLWNQADERICQFSSMTLRTNSFMLLKEVFQMSNYSKSRKQQPMILCCSFSEMTILQGWPPNGRELPTGLEIFYHMGDELAVDDGNIIFNGAQCLVPASLRHTMMEHTRCAHSGVVGSLQQARLYVNWPSMISDIRNCVKSCPTCNEHKVTTAEPDT